MQDWRSWISFDRVLKFSSLTCGIYAKRMCSIVFVHIYAYAFGHFVCVWFGKQVCTGYIAIVKKIQITNSRKNLKTATSFNWVTEKQIGLDWMRTRGKLWTLIISFGWLISSDGWQDKLSEIRKKLHSGTILYFNLPHHHNEISNWDKLKWILKMSGCAFRSIVFLWVTDLERGETPFLLSRNFLLKWTKSSFESLRIMGLVLLLIKHDCYF